MLSECTQFVAILDKTLSIIVPIFSVVELFRRVGFDYYKQAMIAMEALVCYFTSFFNLILVFASEVHKFSLVNCAFQIDQSALKENGLSQSAVCCRPGSELLIELNNIVQLLMLLYVYCRCL